MRLIPTLLVPVLMSSLAHAAPAPVNTPAKILEKACLDGSCAEGYKVRFRQISFEPSRQQATLFVTLVPNAGIDYPILAEDFEAQMVQSTFAAICKINRVASFESIIEGGVEAGTVSAEFKTSLRSCLTALTLRTEKALGR